MKYACHKHVQILSEMLLGVITHILRNISKIIYIPAALYIYIYRLSPTSVISIYEISDLKL
jgi:hypothetical protein